MSEISERIKSSIKASGLSHRDLENKTGIPHSAIQRYAAGTTDRIPISRLGKLASALGVTPAYLMGWTSDKSGTNAIPEGISNIHPVAVQRIPMLGEIACGKPIMCNEDRESYVEAGTQIKADFCLTCKGDSMIGAGIHDGDIVFIRKQDIVDNGQVAAVIIDNEATLKRIYFYPDKAKLVLLPDNPQYEPLAYVGEELADIHILGRAIAYQSDVR